MKKTPKLFSTCLAAFWLGTSALLGQPTDDPVATSGIDVGPYDTSWIATLPWSNVTTTAATPNDGVYDAAGLLTAGDDLATVQAEIFNLSQSGGGVLFFPAGDYDFSDHLYMADGVILRGATPAESDARGTFALNGTVREYTLTYDPATNFHFPIFEQDFTTDMRTTGTARGRYFKEIRVGASDGGGGVVLNATEASNYGMVNIDVNGAIITIGDRNEGSTWGTEIPKNDVTAQNILIFGNRLNNGTVLEPSIPRASQNAWQIWPTRTRGKIDVVSAGNTLIANNLIGDKHYKYYVDGDTSQEIIDYTASLGQSGLSNAQQYLSDNGSSINAPDDRARFSDGYGVRLNHVLDYVTAHSAVQEPSKHREGQGIINNFVFGTTRVGFMGAGNGLVVKGNVREDIHGTKLEVIREDGRAAITNNSATQENRGIDITAGHGVVIDDNYVRVQRGTFNSGYMTIDGEGILLQESSSTAHPVNWTVSGNTAHSYIGLYRIRYADSITFSGNTVYGDPIYTDGAVNGSQGHVGGTVVFNNNTATAVYAKYNIKPRNLVVDTGTGNTPEAQAIEGGNGGVGDGAVVVDAIPEVEFLYPTKADLESLSQDDVVTVRVRVVRDPADTAAVSGVKVWDGITNYPTNGQMPNGYWDFDGNTPGQPAGVTLTLVEADATTGAIGGGVYEGQWTVPAEFDLRGLLVAEVRLESQTGVTGGWIQKAWAFPEAPAEDPLFTGGSLDVDPLDLGPLDGQASWMYTADGGLASEQVAVAEGGLDWIGEDGGTLAAGTKHIYTQAGIDSNGKMNRWLAYAPVSISGPAYVRFVATMETRPQGSTVGANDPYELFFGLTDNAAINGAPWNAYVALKHPVGESVVVGVDGTGAGGTQANAGVVLDAPMLVIAKYETNESGQLTAIKVWINPRQRDEATPDHTFTLTEPGVVLSAQDHLKFRAQNMPVRIDHLMVEDTWAEVIPAEVPVTGGDLDVDGLAQGELNGQDRWIYQSGGTARLQSENVVVAPGGLDWIAADGGTLPSGTEHIYTQAGVGANGKMDRWLSYAPVSVDGPAYVRFVTVMETRPQDSTIGANDPYELFFGLTDNDSISGAPWNAYVALKHPLGESPLIGVDGTAAGGTQVNAEVVLDTPMLVVAKYETNESGQLTAIKVWINPVEADEGTPDHTFTLTEPGVVLSAQDNLKFRMQNMPARIDHLAIGSTWAEVVPEMPVFDGGSLDVEPLALGELNGQDGWLYTADGGLASEQVAVAEGGLNWIGEDGGTLAAGTKHIYTQAGIDSNGKMNRWLAYAPVSISGPAYVRFVATMETRPQGSTVGANDPYELFFGLTDNAAINGAPWNAYVALKHPVGESVVVGVDGTGAGGTQANAGVVLDAPMLVIAKYETNESGQLTAIKVWINPRQRDEATPDHTFTLTEPGVVLSAQDHLKFRAQNMPVRIDHLMVEDTWAEVIPAEVPVTGGDLDVDGLAQGELNGQDRWIYQSGGTARLQSENVVVAPGGLDWIAADGGTLPSGTEHIYTQAGVGANGKMDRWLSYAPVSVDGPAYVRFVTVMETRPQADSTIGANDPYELFFGLTDNDSISGAPWNAYVALKHPLGESPLIGVDGTAAGGTQVNAEVVLDTPMLVVAKYETNESGQLTAIKVWINPVEADEGTPDHTFTLTEPGVVLSAQDNLKFRMQNMPARIDHLTIGSTWAEVVPAAPVIFTGGSLDVDPLDLGPLGGQDGWAYTADGGLPAEGLTVEAGGLTWLAPDGGLISEGTKHIYAQAGLATYPKMNRWLAYSPVSLTGPAYVRFVAQMETRPEGSVVGATDPYELFFGLTDNAAINGAPWSAYVALKHPLGESAVVGVDGTGSSGLEANADVVLDAPMLVVAKYETNESGQLTAIKVWINPIDADEGTPDHTFTLTEPGVVLADQEFLKFRAQNMPVRIDHLYVGDTWASVVPEAGQAQPPALTLDASSVAADLGASASLSVQVTSVLPVTYQWRKGGVDIEGATNATLDLDPLTLEDAGEYTVVVTSDAGSTESDPITVEVIVPGEVVTVFLETFDAGTTAETAASVNLTDLGWNVHHSFEGIYLNGLATGAAAPNDVINLLTSASLGDPRLGEPHGYAALFVNNYPLYGRGEEGARPDLPGPHPTTNEYYHNRTLAHFLWTETEISSGERERLLEFNFVQGNRDAQYHNFFPAVRIDGTWYVYVVDADTLNSSVRLRGAKENVFDGNQFTQDGGFPNDYNAQPYSFEWSESGWTALTFDGSTGANSTVGMALGDALEGALPAGDITGVGVYAPENVVEPYNFNGFRIDSIELLAEAPPVADLFTFTFNNESDPNRPIAAANWTGVYSSAALPLATSDAIFAELSDGVTSEETPGAYKAGFLYMSGKNGQAAPEGFLAWADNTNVVDVPQLPQGGVETVNPQTDWYSDGPNSVTDLTELAVADLVELTMRARPRNNNTVRYHFALQIAGEWYISEQSFMAAGTDWSTFTLNVADASWYTGVVGESSVNFDFAGTTPTLVTTSALDQAALLDTVGIYIDTDDAVGEQDSWARVDSITLSAEVPPVLEPIVVNQPEDASVVEGGTAMFSVTVDNPEEVTYQWRKDGTEIALATGDTLTLENVVSGDAGSYDVVITGPGGTTTSAAATLTVLAPPTVEPTVLNVDANGGNQTINVTADGAVSWTAATDASWISITSGAAGSGNGSVGLTILANTVVDARSAVVTVAGVDVTVNQVGAAEFIDVSPLDSSFDIDGGEFTVSVIATEGQDWTAVSNDSWITVTSGENYEGSASVTFTVARSNDAGPRTGTLTIGGFTHTVSQDGLAETFLPGAVAGAGSSWSSDWLGTFWIESDGENVFIYSAAHGWWAAYLVNSEGAMWAYDYLLETWIYTTPEYYPWMYILKIEGWALVNDTEDGPPRHFWVYDLGEWVLEADLGN